MSCFNDRTSAKPPTRDLFSPDAGFAKPVTLDSLLNGEHVFIRQAMTS